MKIITNKMKYSFILKFNDISNDDINKLCDILIDNKIKFNILKSDRELKENQKYKKVINKAIKYIEDNARYYIDEDEGLVFYIEEKEETFYNNLLDILKGVEYE